MLLIHYNANIYYNDITINIITSNLKMRCNNYESPIIILIQAKQEHIFLIISVHLNNKHVHTEIILTSYASTPVTSLSSREF